MSKWVFMCFFSLLFSADTAVLTIDGKAYSLQRFYEYYPKAQWENAGPKERDRVFSDFIKRELCVLEAKRLGLESDPVIKIKIKNFSKGLLVNESYEQIVALPLIDPDELEKARVFAKKELLVEHILIGFSDSYLASPPQRSLDSALVLAQNIGKLFINGSLFSDLAKTYSDDPSVNKNSGSVGWVAWGKTVPEFQSVAFSLDIGFLSEPVLTSFGYHLILVRDSRSSDYYYMSNQEFERAIINLSLAPLRKGLRAAALSYDSLQIKEHGIYFNKGALFKISEAYRLEKKQNSINNTSTINTVNFLNSINFINVVCVYNSSGFGTRWFANKINQFPSSRPVALASEDAVLSVFKTILLQDIAIKNGLLLGIDLSFSFISRRDRMISDVLYEAYIKFLLSNVSEPDSFGVYEYYNKNMIENYMGPETVLVDEIRVNSRSLADSLYKLIGSEDDFNLISEKFSLVNHLDENLGGPISRKNNPAFYDAVSALLPGQITPPVSSPGNMFSLLLLKKKNSPVPIPLERVYSHIESLLLKEGGASYKDSQIDGLLNKYIIERHMGLLE